MNQVSLTPRAIIFKGVYSLYFSNKKEDLSNVLKKFQDALVLFMKEKEYVYGGHPVIRGFFYNYGEYNFLIERLVNPRVSLLDKIRARMQGKQATDLAYFRELKQIRLSYPVRVFVTVEYNPADNSDRFLVEIYTYPALYLQYSQLDWPLKITREKYDEILLENTLFISRIAKALYLKEIFPPAPLSQEVRAVNTADLLRQFGFKDSAGLLESAHVLIEKGELKEGLSDLRNAIEVFVKEFGEQYGYSELRDGKIQKFVNILRDNEYLVESMRRGTDSILRTGIYDGGLQVAAHGRHKFNLDLIDARFLFSVTCTTLEYVLEKIKFRGFEFVKSKHTKNTMGDQNGADGEEAR